MDTLIKVKHVIFVALALFWIWALIVFFSSIFQVKKMPLNLEYCKYATDGWLTIGRVPHTDKEYQDELVRRMKDRDEMWGQIIKCYEEGIGSYNK